MDRLQQINPFAKRESHDAKAIIAYRVFTIGTWLLAVLSSAYYSVHAPDDDVLPRRSIWDQNAVHHTAFSMNPIIVSIYWIILFLLQIGYVWALFSSFVDYLNAASGVGSHFVFNNLLQFAFVMLFVRSHFIWAEIILIINFFNLSALYFRHPIHPRFIHIPVISGPLAWTFVALYWNGAIMVDAESLVARIIANIAIWGILVYGLFFLVVYGDYTMGFELSTLCAAIGVSQFLRQIVALQWIFAFTIMGTLFVCTLAIAVPGFFGKDISFTRSVVVVDDDRERAPLLEDN